MTVIYRPLESFNNGALCTRRKRLCVCSPAYERPHAEEGEYTSDLNGIPGSQNIGLFIDPLEIYCYSWTCAKHRLYKYCLKVRRDTTQTSDPQPSGLSAACGCSLRVTTSVHLSDLAGYRSQRAQSPSAHGGVGIGKYMFMHRF